MTHPSTQSQPQRRTFLHWLTYAASVAAAAIVSVPLVAFLLGALRRKNPNGFPSAP